MKLSDIKIPNKQANSKRITKNNSYIITEDQGFPKCLQSFGVIVLVLSQSLGALIPLLYSLKSITWQDLTKLQHKAKPPHAVFTSFNYSHQMNLVFLFTANFWFKISSNYLSRLPKESKHLSTTSTTSKNTLVFIASLCRYCLSKTPLKTQNMAESIGIFWSNPSHGNIWSILLRSLLLLD